MTDPAAPQDRAAWRRELRETVSGLFGPVPERVEITAVFECVCDGTCPKGCIHCVACSGRPAEVTEGSEGDEGLGSLP